MRDEEDRVRVETLLVLRRFAEAEVCARALVAADPQSAAALILLARVLSAQDQDVPAAQMAQSAVALAPEEPESYQILAECLTRIDASAAIDAARRAVELAPHTPATHYALARALNQGTMAERREAVAVAERVIALAPHSADAFNLLGLTLFSVGRAEEGAAAYHQALELDPQHVQATNNLAIQDMDSGRLTTAGRRLRFAVSTDPQDGRVRANLDALILLFCVRLMIGCLVAVVILGTFAWAGAAYTLRASTGIVLIGYGLKLAGRTGAALPPRFGRWGAGLWWRVDGYAKALLVVTVLFVAGALTVAFGPDEWATGVGWVVARPPVWVCTGAGLIGWILRADSGID